MLFIHPLTIIYIFFSLITNQYFGLVFLYLFGLIHELSHVIMARIFHIKTDSIYLYPTGFKANISDFSSLSRYKQLLIVLSGPLSYFLSALLISIFFNFNIISVYGKRLCESYNLLILIFNLLPIYPLDGGKVIDIIFASFLDEYQWRKYRMLISFLIIILLIITLKSLGDLMMFLFVLIGFLSDFINFKKNYLIFLVKRKFIDNHYKIKINRKMKIFRFRNNIYLDENKNIFTESETIEKIISRSE